MHVSSSNGLSALLLEIDDATEHAIRRAVELAPRELAALVLVQNRSGCSLDWLHRRLGLTQSGAVRLIDRLEALGLVRRRREAGRRRTQLSLSREGLIVADRGVEVRARAIKEMLSGLTEHERATFLVLAERALSVQSRTRDEGDQVCRLCDWARCVPNCPVDGWECGSSDAETSVAGAS